MKQTDSEVHLPIWLRLLLILAMFVLAVPILGVVLSCFDTMVEIPILALLAILVTFAFGIPIVQLCRPVVRGTARPRRYGSGILEDSISRAAVNPKPVLLIIGLILAYAVVDYLFISW